MYSWAQFRKDFFPAVYIAFALMIVFFVGIAITDNINIVAEFLKHPWETMGVILVFMVCLLAALLSYRSWFYITHQGWKRLLLLVALVAFVWPIVLQLSENRVELDDVFAGVFAGAAIAAVAIAVPQLIYAVIRWVKAGFESSTSEND